MVASLLIINCISGNSTVLHSRVPLGYHYFRGPRCVSFLFLLSAVHVHHLRQMLPLQVNLLELVLHSELMRVGDGRVGEGLWGPGVEMRQFRVHQTRLLLMQRKSGHSVIDISVDQIVLKGTWLVANEETSVGLRVSRG